MPLTLNGTSGITYPSGAVQNNAPGVTSFTASGSITAGAPVMLNNNGTVTALSSQTGTNGTPANLSSTQVTDMAMGFDPTGNKVIYAYSYGYSTSKGYARVGTISGSTITFGSDTLFENVLADSINVLYDSANQKVVIVYRDFTSPSFIGYAIVGTISGNSISFGTRVAFTVSAITGGQNYLSATMADGKVVITYRQQSNNAGFAVVGTVSGTSISFGTAVQFASFTNYTSVGSIGGAKVLIGYRDNSTFGAAIVGTVSGTSISFGTPTVFRSATVTSAIKVVGGSTDRAFIVVDISGGSIQPYYAVISGTSLSFNTPGNIAVDNGTNSNFGVAYLASRDAFYLTYIASSRMRYNSYVAKGASIAIAANTVQAIEASDQRPSFNGAAIDNNGALVQATYNSSEYPGYLVISTPSVSNYGLTIGIANSSVTNGQTVPVTTFGGTATNQTGLSPNVVYYVNSSGLSTSSVDSALLGKAVSTTSMIITGGGT